jgi:hypothetical protein
MSHQLVVKTIKNFYKEKLKGNFQYINKLDKEELKKEKTKYQHTP